MMLSDHDWALTVLCEESRPDAAVTVSEWADEHRVLSSKASAEPGLWRTDRRRISARSWTRCPSYSTVETVVVMKGAQVGMSEGRAELHRYAIHHAPVRRST
jgi:phage terminase large subunit GpA-like protein